MSALESRVSPVSKCEDDLAKTQEIAQIGLKRASTISRLTSTSVGFWNLAEPIEGEKQIITRERITRREYVIDEDDRRKVQSSDFSPQGRYRFVCKLIGQCKENKADAEIVDVHGSGWLIAKDLVVTAGHMLYKSTDKWGGLISAKVYIGYNGNDLTNVEVRHGKFVAAPTEWIKSSSPSYDVGFIKLSRPFTNVDPVKFANTPDSGHEELGVVGYPYELDSGTCMYGHFLKGRWNLANSSRRMLEYQIDTSGGQSGSPVLRYGCRKSGIAPDQHKCQLSSIGVHVNGGYLNEASVIGPAGNVFEDFILAIKVKSGSCVSDRVKSTVGGGLGQIKSFMVLTVEPPGTKTIQQLSPDKSTGTSNKAKEEITKLLAGLSSDEIQDLLQKFLDTKLNQNSTKKNELSEQHSSNQQTENIPSENPQNLEDENSDSSPTPNWSHQSDSDES